MVATDRLMGGYRLGPVLGRGAMGVVYKGVAVASGQEAAVKTLRPDLLSSGERGAVLERFLHEADISKGLEHENIVQVFDSGRDGDDVFMAMELLIGRELKQALDKGEVIPPERVEQLMNRLLSALSYSHRQGIIHRDIKPANILMVNTGGVKVMDFGIARVESSEMTNAGAMLGTPAYMSPEQVIGERVDRRTDIYSAGVVLYQLLTGLKPFQGSLTLIMQQVLSSVPPAPSAANLRVSRAFDTVIARAMAKDREGRFESADEFSEALAAAFAVAREESASEDATIFMDMDATVMEDGTLLEGGEEQRSQERIGPEVPAALGDGIRSLLQKGLDEEFSDKDVGTLKNLLAEYARTMSVAAGGSLPPADPRLSAILERDCSAFTDTVLPKLKELIVAGAPLPGKAPSLDDRMDWMGCIDVFGALGEALDHLGRPGAAVGLAAAVRGELLGAAMMYAGQINTLLFSPDHLELNRVAADFMRLDILQWGLETLGGEMEMKQLGDQVRMFSGQVLKRVASTIREFVHSRDAMARFDAAGLLYYIEELIVIAERTLEGGEAGGYQRTLGRDIVLEFIESAEKLVDISAEELAAEAVEPGASADAFGAKLKQLAGLFQFSVRLDDEECREPLNRLAEAVRRTVESLVDSVEAALPDAASEDLSVRRAQLTALWEIADSLGWANLSERLLGWVRDDMLAAMDQQD